MSVVSHAMVSHRVVLCLALLGPAQAQDPRLRVQVDPRVELLSIVFRLAGNPEYGRAHDSAYLEAVEERFGPLRGHRVVGLARELRSPAGVSYDAPQSLAVHLDPVSLELLVPLDPWPPGLDGRWRSADLQGFLEALRAFREESEFPGFFAAQRPFFDRVESSYRAAVAEEDVIAWFDGFFGARPGASFTLVPALLCGPNNYGPRAVLGEREALYQILGTGPFDAGGVPRLGEHLIPLLVHEMAHSYCNPIVDANLDALSGPGERLFSDTEAVMRRQAYGNARTVLCESLVRACVVLRELETGGEAAAVRALASEESRGFPWSLDIVGALQAFRASPPASGRFLDFVPEVVRAFEATAGKGWGERLPPFRGPLNAVFTRPGLLVVRPEPGLAAFDRYLEQVHEQVLRGKGATLVAASEVSPERAASASLLLYGTPDTNALLGRVMEAAGWSIDRGSIRVGAQVFEGEDLFLIACWPSPFGSGHAVAVYAAAELGTLVGANSAFHGPTDFVVARRSAGPGGRADVVAQGDFPKDLENTWRQPPRQP